jgi:hypothetical protein
LIVDNPSGNSEWERYSATSGPFVASEHDLALDGQIPAGTVTVEVEGLDFQNLSFFYFDKPLLCVLPDGSPCGRRFQPFLIGDTVFLDSSGDGNQDPGEPGIAGVLVERFDINGNLVDSMVTDGNGNYFFEVGAGEHVVTVSPDNFLTGGALEGLVTTTGDTLSTTIIDANDLTLDFGYRPLGDVGTGTPGYWKNHPDAWPSDEIVIGGVVFSKADAIDIMSSPTKGDMTMVMFQHLVSAKLNVAIGTDPSCIFEAINAADAWMAAHPVGSNVKAKSPAWKNEGNDLKNQLDAYNNGLLCAPHRG